MSKQDYYSVLGLEKSATEADIKNSYRKLAMKFHPDRNNEAGAEEKFKEIKEAYEFLSDPVKKATYDKWGHNAPSQSHTFDDFQDFSSIFSELFGGDFGFSRQSSPIYSITISLEDAYTGRSIKIDSVTVNIPRGVRHGTKFSISKKIYRIDIKPHPKFKRSNDDLLIDVEISAIEAMLGIVVDVEHLDQAKLQFSIPSGAQHGQIYKLTGKGMNNPENNMVGDLLVRVSISVPKNLSEEQKTVLKALAHRESINI